MHAITLRQPYASLVASGVKQIETRSWSTRHRGPLAIHAALCTMDVEAALKCFRRSNLPRGRIVCIVELVDCREMTEDFIKGVPPEEFAVGLYQPGRWAWMFSETIRVFDPPVPARGALRIWEWNDSCAFILPASVPAEGSVTRSSAISESLL